MLEREFDRFAEEYEELLKRSIALSGESSSFFARYKPADVRKHLTSAGMNAAGWQILDFGCGVGTSLPYLKQYFPDAELLGADISRKSLELAHQHHGSIASLVNFDAHQDLPFDVHSFDLIFSACVFHHIPHNLHNRILGGILRILKPGGWLFLFEHNPLNPLTLRVVNSCPFDENAVLISAGEMKSRVKRAGFEEVAVRYRIFLPGILRKLRWVESGLTWCPLGAQYYIVARHLRQ